jgi:FkbM family methyltransferase
LSIVDAAKRLLRTINIEVCKADAFQRLARSSAKREADLKYIAFLLSSEPETLLDCIERSQSEVLQDVFVLLRSQFKREGYFVEFGAASGVGGSNTYLLEKVFGWSGIVAEPARCWHGDLKLNRACHVETSCVWRTTGDWVEFVETADAYTSGVSDAIDKSRVQSGRSVSYEVPTVSLVDLLQRYQAPTQIDYLSMDTEGSEFDILNAFDFDRYNVRLITCEHNRRASREAVRSLLSGRDYRLVPSPCEFEDWFERTG